CKLVSLGLSPKIGDQSKPRGVASLLAILWREIVRRSGELSPGPLSYLLGLAEYRGQTSPSTQGSLPSERREPEKRAGPDRRRTLRQERSPAHEKTVPGLRHLCRD